MVRVSQTAFSANIFGSLLGVVDMEVLKTSQGHFLYSASRFDGTISIFELTEDQDPVLIQSLTSTLPENTLAMPDLTPVMMPDGAALFCGSSSSNTGTMREISAEGILGSPVLQALTDSSSTENGAAIQFSVSLMSNGQSFLIASNFIDDGLMVVHTNEAGELTETDGSSASASAEGLTDVTSLAATELGGFSYVLASSGADATVVSYRVTKDGDLQERSRLSPENGLWVTQPTAIETVKSDGTIFVLIGGGTSSSLTVAELGLGGHMRIVDHITDEIGVSLSQLSALETFSINGRGFVVTGGSEDSVSVFELDGDGALHFVTSVSDKGGTSMTEVAAISATVFGDEVQLVVSSGSGGGTSHFSLDMSTLGLSINGDEHADVLTGTSDDDILLGRSGNDHITGGAGDDRLVDGSGQDVLIGGVGEDTFVLVYDQEADTIVDFENNTDVIDISDWPLLHDMSRLVITQLGDGVRITYFEEEVLVYSQDGSLSASDIDPTDFNF